MKNAFRQSMAWLHTWTGLVAGWVLFFVFVTGTVGYFQIEIGRWMRPELPLPDVSLPDQKAVTAAEGYLRRIAPDAQSWSITLPDRRNGSWLHVAWEDATSSRRAAKPNLRPYLK